jgi:hypothetical protein
MADDENTKVAWVQALQHLVDTHAQKRQRHVINETK